MDVDELWGGTITSLSIEPTTWILRTRVEVKRDGVSREYEVVLEDVTDLHAHRAVPLPWTYAELTELHVSETNDGVVVEFILWEDDTGLTARCGRVQVAPADRLTRLSRQQHPPRRKLRG